jgi:type IV secretion system protein VirB10
MLFGPASVSPVRGERGRPIVAQPLPLQARLSNLLALVLMLGIGIVILGWYYLHMMNRSQRSRSTSALGVATAKSLADVALPPLPRIGPPSPSDPSLSEKLMAEVAAAPSMPPALPVAASVVSAGAGVAGADAPPVHASALERRLSGAAFATTTPSQMPAPSTGVASPAPIAIVQPLRQGEDRAGRSDLYSALQTSNDTPLGQATLMSNQRMLLPKGAFIDCTLETAIDSSLPGLTTCVTATDTFGADGNVVLLERGTKLVGETRGQVQQGSSRVFVLWTEARTPTGVLVPLDSPGADQLGRSGLPGEVERHFWQRFGAAVLISTLDGAIQAAVQSSSRGSGTVIYSPSGPQDVASEVLKNTLSIAPTVIKRNGDRIQVLVARDVDFSRVYELRRATQP